MREIAAYLCQSRQCKFLFSCCFCCSSLFIVTLCCQYCCAAVVIIGAFYCCCCYCCCCYWLIVLVFIRAMRSSRFQANKDWVDSSKVWVVFQMQRLYGTHTAFSYPRAPHICTRSHPTWIIYSVCRLGCCWHLIYFVLFSQPPPPSPMFYLFISAFHIWSSSSLRTITLTNHHTAKIFEYPPISAHKITSEMAVFVCYMCWREKEIEMWGRGGYIGEGGVSKWARIEKKSKRRQTQKIQMKKVSTYKFGEYKSRLLECLLCVWCVTAGVSVESKHTRNCIYICVEDTVILYMIATFRLSVFPSSLLLLARCFFHFLLSSSLPQIALPSLFLTMVIPRGLSRSFALLFQYGNNELKYGL